jgi:6-phosphogluconolactonase (cycloisomerase 2 family)
MHSRSVRHGLLLLLFATCGNIAAFATTPTITISSPDNDSETASPVHYVGLATSPSCANGISAIRIYSAPGVEANTSAGGTLDTYINLPIGTSHTVVVAYDNCGGVATSDVAVTITSETQPAGFVYTVNTDCCQAGTGTDAINEVMGFTVVPGTGALAKTLQGPVNANKAPYSVASDSGGYRLYVGDYVSGDVFPYFINRDNGYLTPVPGAPFPADRSVFAVAVHPNNALIFAALNENASGDGVAVFQLQSNGSLVEAPGSPYATEPGPDALTIDPTGKFLYVTSDRGYINAFAINVSNATLTPVSGSPFQLTLPNNCDGTYGTLPTDIIDLNGKQVYTADSELDSISGYSIDSANGTLTEISGSPWPDFGGCTVPIGSYGYYDNPASLAVDSTGKFLYGFDYAMEEISIYSIAADGALTFVKNTAQGLVGCFGPIRTDPTGNYIYAATCGGMSVPYNYLGLAGFSINHTTGDLTPLPSSPYTYPTQTPTNQQEEPTYFTVTR